MNAWQPFGVGSKSTQFVRVATVPLVGMTAGVWRCRVENMYICAGVIEVKRTIMLIARAIIIVH